MAISGVKSSGNAPQGGAAARSGVAVPPKLSYSSAMAGNGDKAIFLDRDGVINIDTGYPHRVEDFALVEGAAEAIRRANAAGYKVLVATNQGGVALGRYGKDDVTLFHQHMLDTLGAMDARIDAIAFCPHHPESKWESERSCRCRKPEPGMILELAERHGIDLASSAMIGDRATDVEAAEAAGTRGFLFDGGNLDECMAEVLDALAAGTASGDGGAAP